MSRSQPFREPVGAPTYVALSGGIGGAKLSLGLAALLGDHLSLVVNTGDDFEHLGLAISPDIDTTLYTLAGLVNPETGWGRRNETWSFMASLAALGGPDWFKLGDADLAMHVERTRRLKAGDTLTSVCAHVRQCLQVAPHILPMSDEPVRTLIETDSGSLEFQEYFVREQCRPVVRAVRFAGAKHAHATPAVLAALSAPTLAGVIICPSNPYLSVDPILSIGTLRAAIRACAAPVLAVSPIIGGKAVKGPTAKLMGELGVRCDAASIARHYEGLIDGFILDRQDAGLIGAIAVPTLVTETLMRDRDDKIALARSALAFAASLSNRQPAQSSPNTAPGVQ